MSNGINIKLNDLKTFTNAFKLCCLAAKFIAIFFADFCCFLATRSTIAIFGLSGGALG